MVDVIILAGGLGTRLRSVSGETPKPMVEIAGEPFLYKLMRSVSNMQCKKIILALCYKAPEIIDSVTKDKPVDCEVDFAIEESPAGTGGAILHAMQKVEGSEFIVLNGDSICDIDYSKFIAFARGKQCCMATYHVESTERYGRVQVNPKTLKVISFEEKGLRGSGYINVGVYYFHKKFFSGVTCRSLEVDILSKNYQQIYTYPDVKNFIDIGVPDDFFWAEKNHKLLDSWI